MTGSQSPRRNPKSRLDPQIQAGAWTIFRGRGMAFQATSRLRFVTCFRPCRGADAKRKAFASAFHLGSIRFGGLAVVSS